MLNFNSSTVGDIHSNFMLMYLGVRPYSHLCKKMNKWLRAPGGWCASRVWRMSL